MNISKVPLSLAAAALAVLFLAACGDGDAGLSRAEVEEAIRRALADMPPPTTPGSS